jgi:hypothetical protein
MDALIRPRMSALALAAVALLALAPAVAGDATADQVKDARAHAPARKSHTRSAGDAATVAARLRPAERSAAGPRAAPDAVPPAAAVPRRPLQLTLADGEMRMLLSRYQPGSGEGAHSAFDDVTVVAPAELQPMRDQAHEVWGGIAAPVWALLNPTQAWRIFLPIPPK